MALRRTNDQRYSAFWRSLANFLRINSGFPVSGVARSGSRRRGIYRPDSDLDIIFSVAGDPPRSLVYPDLVTKLWKVMNVEAEIGGNYHVINIRKADLDMDLVLLTEQDFNEELRSLRATAL